MPNATFNICLNASKGAQIALNSTLLFSVHVKWLTWPLEKEWPNRTILLSQESCAQTNPRPPPFQMCFCSIPRQSSDVLPYHVCAVCMLWLVVMGSSHAAFTWKSRNSWYNFFCSLYITFSAHIFVESRNWNINHFRLFSPKIFTKILYVLSHKLFSHWFNDTTETMMIRFVEIYVFHGSAILLQYLKMITEPASNRVGNVGATVHANHCTTVNATTKKMGDVVHCFIFQMFLNMIIPLPIPSLFSRNAWTFYSVYCFVRIMDPN